MLPPPPLPEPPPPAADGGALAVSSLASAVLWWLFLLASIIRDTEAFGIALFFLPFSAVILGIYAIKELGSIPDSGRDRRWKLAYRAASLGLLLGGPAFFLLMYGVTQS